MRTGSEAKMSRTSAETKKAQDAASLNDAMSCAEEMRSGNLDEQISAHHRFAWLR